jgi:hypothetical protein
VTTTSFDDEVLEFHYMHLGRFPLRPRSARGIPRNGSGDGAADASTAAVSASVATLAEPNAR